MQKQLNPSFLATRMAADFLRVLSIAAEACFWPTVPSAPFGANLFNGSRGLPWPDQNYGCRPEAWVGCMPGSFLVQTFQQLPLFSATGPILYI